MTFWDSSALFAVLAGEVGSDILVAVLNDDPQAVLWWGTPVELVSAASHLLHERRTDAGAFADLVSTIEEFVSEAEQVDPTEQVRLMSIRMLRVHSLRAADAFQLAAALIWTDHNPSGARFVCLDKRLREAAGREGFTVLPGAV